MHAVIQLLGFWALAFATLSVAVVGLNLFYGVIDNDLVLHSVGKEAVIAGTASLVEGAGLWLVATFVPGAVRAMVIPALIVVIIYRLSHLADWSRYDALLLLAFQLVIVFSGMYLFLGHFEPAIVILGGFGIFLAVIAGIAKSL